MFKKKALLKLYVVCIPRQFNVDLYGNTGVVHTTRTTLTKPFFKHRYLYISTMVSLRVYNLFSRKTTRPTRFTTRLTQRPPRSLWTHGTCH